MSSASPMPAPMPTAAQETIIETVFSVASMALATLTFVPNIPPNVLTIANTALTDLKAAYEDYTKNPTADLYDEMQVVVSDALADIKAALHPTP